MEVTAAESGTIALSDGPKIPFRAIRPSDREALQRFHGRHSDSSIYLRFFSMQRTLGDAQAKHFTELDGTIRFALVALDPADPAEIIGVARFDGEPGTNRAEYAAIVADAWQGHGIGLQLTRHLIQAALRRGVTTFCAYVLPENLRMLNLLRDLGLPETVHYEDGIERIDVDLLGDRQPDVLTHD
jgi:RimJ/RimL family protein N-acetyltransferase